MNRSPIEVGEWYHCYSRGVDKRRVFERPSDYDRFLTLMFVANATKSVHVSNLRNTKLQHVLADTRIDRAKPIVELGAYCLMPNHVHFLVKELHEGGIAKYMQKIFTGYTMYFNKSRERTGALFSGTFKSRHVHDDVYFQWALAYIHLNPVELWESNWKRGVGNIERIERQLARFQFSSLSAFQDEKHWARKLLGQEAFELVEKKISTRELLEEAQAYYTETNIKV